MLRVITEHTRNRSALIVQQMYKFDFNKDEMVCTILPLLLYAARDTQDLSDGHAHASTLIGTFLLLPGLPERGTVQRNVTGTLRQSQHCSWLQSIQLPDMIVYVQQVIAAFSNPFSPSHTMAVSMVPRMCAKNNIHTHRYALLKKARHSNTEIKQIDGSRE